MIYMLIIKNNHSWCFHLWPFLLPLNCDRKRQSSFSLTHKIDNSGNIGARGSTMWKQKKSSNKMLPQLALNPGPRPFGSDVLLPGLLRHVLLGIPLNCLLFTTSILDLDHFVKSIEHGHMQILDCNACLNGSENRAKDPSGWGAWLNAHHGNILLLVSFLFSCGEVDDVNVAIVTNFN